MVRSAGFWFPLFEGLVAVQIMGTRNLLVQTHVLKKLGNQSLNCSTLLVEMKCKSHLISTFIDRSQNPRGRVDTCLLSIIRDIGDLVNKMTQN